MKEREAHQAVNDIGPSHAAPEARADDVGGGAAAPWRASADAAMTRYANGVDAAFGDLYDALAPRLYAFFRRQLRDQARVEDLVQQTFLLMHQARGRFVPGAAVAPWAFAIARRLFIDQLRRGKSDAVAPAADELPAAPATSVESATLAALQARRTLQSLEVELRRLSPDQRHLFELVHVDGLSLEEAAAVLGISHNAAKLRMSRLVGLLRRLIGESVPDEAMAGASKAKPRAGHPVA